MRESRKFTDKIFSDPTKSDFRNRRVKNVKVKFTPATEYDCNAIFETNSYKQLMNRLTLGSVIESAHKLASEIQYISGIDSVDMKFAPGANEGEIEIEYKFGSTFTGVMFPTINTQYTTVFQGIYLKNPENKDKWYHSFVNGLLLGKYKYSCDYPRHSFELRKIWETSHPKINSSAKIKYSTKWLDANVNEDCWTKEYMASYDMRKDTIMFKNRYIMYPSKLYAKILHKSRKNLIDTTKCSSGLLKSSLYSDSLMALRIGYKDFSGDKLRYSFIKTSAELGYNRVDSPFVKLKGYLNHRFFLNKILVNQTLLIEKAFFKSLRINDSPFLRGMKGIYEFPGAKTYRDPIVEPGKEHIGSRITNTFTARYEAKLSFPTLKPFSEISTNFFSFNPYIYGTLGYTKANESKGYALGSAGIGISAFLRPLRFGFYYALASFRPNHDAPKEFGFYIGTA